MPSLLERAVKAAGPEAVFAALTPEQRQRLRYLWPALARESQLPPLGDWLTWVFLAGRGAGKSRSGAEWIRSEVAKGAAGRIALIAKTPADRKSVV